MARKERKIFFFLLHILESLSLTRRSTHSPKLAGFQHKGNGDLREKLISVREEKSYISYILELQMLKKNHYVYKADSKNQVKSLEISK